MLVKQPLTAGCRARGAGARSQGARQRTVAPAGPNGTGPKGQGDEVFKSLDLKNLNDLPLSKLTETANAVWERLRASSMKDVKSTASVAAPLLPPNMMPGAKGNGNGLVSGARTAEGAAADAGSLAKTGDGNGGGGNDRGGREQQLMMALAQAQEEKRQLADRAEMLRTNLSMLEAKNSKMSKEMESVETGRSSALKLRDMLLEERDSLAGQLAEAQEQLQVATQSMEDRDGALEALRQSQQQLQEELRDAVERLQLVDLGTEDLRSQLASLESSRVASASERDDLAAHLQELVGKVDELSGLFAGELEASGVSLPTAAVGSEASASASASPASTARDQLQQLRSTTEGAFAALRSAREELGVLRSENQQMATRAEALTSSNLELSAAAEALRSQVAEAATALEASRVEAAEARAREQQLAEALATTSSERDAANAAVAAGAAERDALAGAVAELTAIKDAAAGAGSGLVELAQMSTQLAALQGQLNAARASETALKRQLATAEVALLDARRQAAATETRLSAERDAALADAASLRATLHARTQATTVSRRSGVAVAAAPGQFVNTNRFWVPADLLFDFVKSVAAREVALVDATGFLGIAVRSEEHNVMSVATQWESIPAFEAWSSSPEARRQHYPQGVYQYVPKRGEGFPEDFMPFKDMNEAVNAKY